jgi:hypothetical protein
MATAPALETIPISLPGDEGAPPTSIDGNDGSTNKEMSPIPKYDQGIGDRITTLSDFTPKGDSNSTDSS